MRARSGVTPIKAHFGPNVPLGDLGTVQLPGARVQASPSRLLTSPQPTPSHQHERHLTPARLRSHPQSPRLPGTAAPIQVVPMQDFALAQMGRASRFLDATPVGPAAVPSQMLSAAGASEKAPMGAMHTPAPGSMTLPAGASVHPASLQLTRVRASSAGPVLNSQSRHSSMATLPPATTEPMPPSSITVLTPSSQTFPLTQSRVKQRVSSAEVPLSAPASSRESASQVVAAEAEDTVTEHPPEFSAAPDGTMTLEQDAALEAEGRWMQSLENERAERTREMIDAIKSLPSLEGMTAPRDDAVAPTVEATALANFTEFAAETMRDLTARMDALRSQADAAAAGIAARKNEAVVTIERLHEESRQMQQIGGSMSPNLPSSVPELIEARLQEAMELRIQKLTATLSSAMEQKVSMVRGHFQQCEERWKDTIERERQERMESISQVLDVANAATRAAENTRGDVIKDLDHKFQALREHTESALASIGDDRGGPMAMDRSGTAELHGSMADQQQQRYEEERSELILPQDGPAQNEELQASISALREQVGALRQVLQDFIPQSFATLHELGQGLQKTNKDFVRLQAKVQSQLELCKATGSLPDLQRQVQALSHDLKLAQTGVVQLDFAHDDSTSAEGGNDGSSDGKEELEQRSPYHETRDISLQRSVGSFYMGEFMTNSATQTEEVHTEDNTAAQGNDVVPEDISTCMFTTSINEISESRVRELLQGRSQLEGDSQSMPNHRTSVYVDQQVADLNA